MPEHAEVNVQVRYLRERCRGWPVRDFGFEGWSHFQNLPEEGRDKVLQDFFSGNVLEDFTQKGKQVIIHTRKGLLVSHLMFKGRWSVPDDPFLSNYKQHRKPPTEKSNNFWIIGDGGQRLNFYEPEYKGKITIFPAQKDASGVEHLARLGPDVVITPETDPAFAGEEWTLEAFTKRAQRSSQAIKVFLLDQQKQAGLGNVYVCESLYKAKIAPERPAKSLSEAERRNLHQGAKEIVQQAIDSDLDYDNLIQIYNKKSDRAGNAVTKSKIGGRDTHWVPAVQK